MDGFVNSISGYPCSAPHYAWFWDVSKDKEEGDKVGIFKKQEWDNYCLPTQCGILTGNSVQCPPICCKLFRPDLKSMYVKETERSDLTAIICAAEGHWY